MSTVAIQAWLREWDTPRLCALRAHCEDGRLVYRDACNCIRGVFGGFTAAGYNATDENMLAADAEDELHVVGVEDKLGRDIAERNGNFSGWLWYDDHRRRRVLPPLVYAELARREAASAELCSDCPPAGWPTDKTRCAECPRREADSLATARAIVEEALAR